MALPNPMSATLQEGEQFPRELEILRQLADNLPQIVWVTRPDGSHDYYNRPWYDFTGLTRETSNTEGWTYLFHPDDLEQANAAWAEALRTGDPYEIEFRLRRASDGEFRWFLGRALPYRNPAGEIVNWFGTCTDIHEQKRTQAELSEARDAMRKENRRKDQFLGMISHELRTPLNAVFGWTRLMQENVLNEEERVEAVNSIMRNAEAQARLIEDVLDITRIVNHKLSLDRVVLDLVGVVREAAEAVRPSADLKGVQLEVVVETGAQLLVEADAIRLQQVVLNLLTNAVKFTLRGGQVRLRAARERAFAVIEITDTGKGISAELLPHIFERFRQGDSSSTRHHGGLGLGLTIAHQLVLMHGGTIEVHSEGEGQGSRFTVLLPIVALDTRPVAVPRLIPAGKDFPENCLRGIHVMVVDDEASVRDLVALTLTKCGASVTVAASVSDALALMPNLRPDVIVSDIAMPGVDGYEFIQKLRAREAQLGGNIPAIALTAFAGGQDRLRALELGFDQHLTKPVDPAELVRAIAKTRAASLAANNCASASAETSGV